MANTVKLNKNAKAWLKALRGGKYKQARKALRVSGKYCCLGVACDLYGKANGVEWEGDHFMNRSCELPSDVVSWLGLKSDTGEFSEEEDDNLIVCNDDKKMSFKKIANLIVKKKNELFQSAGN